MTGKRSTLPGYVEGGEVPQHRELQGIHAGKEPRASGVVVRRAPGP